MSLRHEKIRALIESYKLMRDLMDPKVTPKVPLSVRKRAYWCLRHFPFTHDVAIKEDIGRKYIKIDRVKDGIFE